jgi:hypothetical protein
LPSGRAFKCLSKNAPMAACILSVLNLHVTVNGHEARSLAANFAEWERPFVYG